MIAKVSKKDHIKAQLKEQGQLQILDNDQNIRAIIEMNDQLEKVRREFHVKDKESQTSAARVILNA